MTTALVLSGDASLGAVQVGMLQALARAGIGPDMLVGTSVGALNAAWLAGDPTPASIDRLSKVWCSLRRRDVFPLQPLHGLGGFVGRRRALLDDSGLRNLLTRNLTYSRLEDAAVPLHVVTVDVLTGRDVLHSRGDAVETITASAAIPGIFPPLVIDGRPHMDGGVVNNTPISHAVDLGADTIWVLAAGYACALPEPPRSALGMALQGLSVLVQHRLAADITRYEATVDLRVAPPLCPIAVSPADFSQTSELIERARTSTEAWLAEGTPAPSHQAALVVPHSEV